MTCRFCRKPLEGGRGKPKEYCDRKCKEAFRVEGRRRGVRSLKRRPRQPLPDGTTARPFPRDPAAYDPATPQGRRLTRALFRKAAALIPDPQAIGA